MAIATDAPPAETLVVAGGKVSVQRAGSGEPLVVLHDDSGSPHWLPFYDQLATANTVYLPTLPGWGRSDVPEWARTPRDIAILTRMLLSQLGLSNVPVVGSGFGGWIAAEIATMCPSTFSRMVLVAPLGLLPRQGEYLDQLMVSGVEYIRQGFADEARFDQVYGDADIDLLEEWEINREMTTRVNWSPYSYSQSLPHLLGSVQAPTLLVRGNQDRVVPQDVVDQYAELLPDATCKAVENAGHFIAIEQPEELAALVRQFLGQA